MIHQKDSRKEIIIFTRYPEPGTTKTRLIPELGANGAAQLQRTMTEQIVHVANQLKCENNIHPAVYFTGGTHHQMKEWLGTSLSYYKQKGNGLGERMMHAFEDSWKRGSNHAVLIGSDCPAIDGNVITEAMQSLNSSQLVLGPSTDGGYYLIGTTKDMPLNTLSLLLTDIPWGYTDVFRTTLDRARNLGVTFSLLKELNDIDLPRDLAYFNYHPNPQ